jgi:hypothetical protein
MQGADSQGEGRLRFSDLMAYLDRVEEEVGAPSKEEEAVLALAAAAEQQQHGITGRKGRRGSVLLPSVSGVGSHTPCAQIQSCGCWPHTGTFLASMSECRACCPSAYNMGRREVRPC